MTTLSGANSIHCNAGAVPGLPVSKSITFLLLHVIRYAAYSYSYSTRNRFRSVCPKDREADPIPSGLLPGDETRAVPHPNRCLPLHHRRHSGKCNNLFRKRFSDMTRSVTVNGASAGSWQCGRIAGAQCWFDQCRRALTDSVLTDSSRFKAWFKSQDSWERHRRSVFLFVCHM